MPFLFPTSLLGPQCGKSGRRPCGTAGLTPWLCTWDPSPARGRASLSLGQPPRCRAGGGCWAAPAPTMCGGGCSPVLSAPRWRLSPSVQVPLSRVAAGACTCSCIWSLCPGRDTVNSEHTLWWPVLSPRHADLLVLKFSRNRLLRTGCVALGSLTVGLVGRCPALAGDILGCGGGKGAPQWCRVLWWLLWGCAGSGISVLGDPWLGEEGLFVGARKPGR